MVPDAIAPRIRTHLARTASLASLVPQPALADFMQSGDFATHLRRTRRLYARRQAHLIAALAPVSAALDVRPDPSGMHLCCALQEDLAAVASDVMLSRAAAKRNLYLRALSAHSVLPDPPQGVLLGYAAFSEEVLDRAAQTLNEVLAELLG